MGLGLAPVLVPLRGASPIRETTGKEEKKKKDEWMIQKFFSCCPPADS
jgi:hypothetical protein